MGRDVVIKFDSVSKIYRLQQQRTLKELLPSFLKTRSAIKKDMSALENVSFEIDRGETVGFIGSNGAGKSTVLKLIAGVTRPTKGYVKVDGRVSPLIELGAGFHPDMTGAENIFLNGVILGLTKKEIKDKFKEIVDFAELWDFIDQPVKHYSSGMYIRLGFAIAVNAVFDILLVDEVLAVGDFRFQQKCFQKLQQIQASGKTIIFVTHDLNSARAFCKKVFLLERGKLSLFGSPDKVVDYYIRKQGFSKSLPKGESKEIEQKSKGLLIEKVIFLDKNDKSKTTFLSGDFLKILIGYRAERTLNDIVFGIALYRSDGIHVYGTNSLLQSKNLIVKRGCGQVSFAIKKLPILSGEIKVTVAAHDRQGNNYDWQEKKYSFNVFQSKAGADGLIDFDAEFSAQND